jgi:hypothetical protein
LEKSLMVPVDVMKVGIQAVIVPVIFGYEKNYNRKPQ